MTSRRASRGSVLPHGCRSASASASATRSPPAASPNRPTRGSSAAASSRKSKQAKSIRPFPGSKLSSNPSGGRWTHELAAEAAASQDPAHPRRRPQDRAGRPVDEMRRLRRGALQHRPGEEPQRLPEVRAPRAAGRAPAPGRAARPGRPLRDRCRGAAARPAQVPGFAPLRRAPLGSAGADRRRRCAGRDAGLDQGARPGLRRVRVRLHGRLDGLGGRRVLNAWSQGRDRAEVAVRLRHRFGRGAHAGGCVVARADGENHRRADRSRRAAPAVHHGPHRPDHGRGLGELRDARRRGDRRAEGSDRLRRAARDRADRAAEASRGLPARRVPAREGRDRHDPRPPSAARQAAPAPLADAGIDRRRCGVTLLADVVRASARVAATPSRLAKVAALADCLRRLEPDEIEIALPYLSGELRQGRLALPYALLRSAAGTAAPSPALTLREVDAAFEQLKNTRGKGAAALRQQRLRSLFERATRPEQDFLVRLIVGELRQGALEGVMLEALAAAAGLAPAQVRRAAMVAGGIAAVARAALAEGAPGLERFAIRLMQPVLPMLAQPAKDPRAALGAAALEWKLDGARVQVHRSGAEVRVFTRSMNEVTAAVPDVVAVARAARGDALIVDGEAIALRADGRPHPFQVTMRRFGRKLDDGALREQLPLSVFFFDCLYSGGVPLVDQPLAERRRALASGISESNLTPWIVTADPDAADAFYK